MSFPIRYISLAVFLRLFAVFPASYAVFIFSDLFFIDFFTCVYCAGITADMSPYYGLFVYNYYIRLTLVFSTVLGVLEQAQLGNIFLNLTQYPTLIITHYQHFVKRPHCPKTFLAEKGVS